jgi:hypothetical protein
MTRESTLVQRRLADAKSFYLLASTTMGSNVAVFSDCIVGLANVSSCVCVVKYSVAPKTDAASAITVAKVTILEVLMTASEVLRMN